MEESLLPSYAFCLEKTEFENGFALRLPSANGGH
jgi:hypothetical protein